MHHYRKLSVWRKAHELTVRIYRTAASFSTAHWAIAGQLRRAAHAIPSNIAEGSGRTANRQFANHLQIAIASARELDYFLQLALELGELHFSDHATLEARANEVTAMLVALRRTVVSRTTTAQARRRKAPTPAAKR
jgi:four helix bundle protein